MQQDDGSRNAIRTFMKNKDENWAEFYKVLALQGQYWKARVLAELIWEYESRTGGDHAEENNESKEND